MAFISAKRKCDNCGATEDCDSAQTSDLPEGWHRLQLYTSWFDGEKIEKIQIEECELCEKCKGKKVSIYVNSVQRNEKLAPTPTPGPGQGNVYILNNLF